ncbi:MAG: substrate-binding domain-containing protein, partial [Kiritimatiellae bacterium]|nr:substrate-binding domain-containing protein [Verrucomicrobiota bacterium]MCG2661338.1 substrate-binding domain-containing protein [Kiritimatiellia bacterium]
MYSQPRITIKKLAEEIGLSVCTINKALNNKPRISPKTRDLVIKSAARFGYRPNTLAKALARPVLSIGFVYPDVWPSHTGLLIRGARESLERLRDHRVNSLLRPLPAGDENSFISVIKDLAGNQVSGLIMCLFDYTTECLNKAWQILNEAKIPFVLLGSDIPGGPQICSVWHDCHRCGRMAAEVLDWMTPNCSVAVFIGRKGLLDHDLKIDGFQSWLNQSRIKLAGIGETHDDPVKGFPVAREVFEKHPDVSGIYIGTENASGICRYLGETGLAGKIKVVATGVSDDVFQGLQLGVVHCSINQN